MAGVFFIGIIITIFTSWMTISMFKDGYVEFIKNSYKDTPSLTIWFFILQIVGILMLAGGIVSIATKNKSLIKNDLSEYDLGLLKTKAGVILS